MFTLDAPRMDISVLEDSHGCSITRYSDTVNLLIEEVVSMVFERTTLTMCTSILRSSQRASFKSIVLPL